MRNRRDKVANNDTSIISGKLNGAADGSLGLKKFRVFSQKFK